MNTALFNDIANAAHKLSGFELFYDSITPSNKIRLLKQLKSMDAFTNIKSLSNPNCKLHISVDFAYEVIEKPLVMVQVLRTLFSSFGTYNGSEVTIMRPMEAL